jgi:hypothetical protein
MEQLSSYKTTRTSASDAQVQPILRFFELIHLADLVHQMIFVYYKEEIVSNMETLVIYGHLTNPCIVSICRWARLY